MQLHHQDQFTRWFRSQPAPIAADQIDRENGILKGVVMCEEGEAKGHGVYIDADFITALVTYDKKHAKTGIKARLGHPTASGDTMGTQLGMFRNFRENKKTGKVQAIADLHLLDAAEDSPTHPGMRTWVMKMAEEQPDFIMSSIVFRPSGNFQLINGKKKYVHSSDEDGEWVRPVSDEPVFVEFDEEKGAAHYYTDLVESGAATNALFSTKINTHLFAAKADEWLAMHPEVLQFAQKNPAAILKWLARIGVKQQNSMSINKIKDFLLGTSDEDAAQQTAEAFGAVKEALTGFQTQIDAEKSAAVKLSVELDAAKTELAALKTEFEEMKAAVAELAATSTEKPSGSGDTPPAGDDISKERAYKSNPINRRLYTKA